MTPDLYPRIYKDDRTIYLEFPGKPGMILTFAVTEGGLHKALQHVPSLARKPAQITGGSNLRRTIAPSTMRKRELASLSPSVKSAASRLIRKLKIGE